MKGAVKKLERAVQKNLDLVAHELKKDTGVAVELYQESDCMVLGMSIGNRLARFPAQSFNNPGLYELLKECIENHECTAAQFKEFGAAQAQIDYWMWVLDTSPDLIRNFLKEREAIAARLREVCGPTHDEEISELRERVAELESACESAETAVANMVASLHLGNPTTK